MLNEEDKWPIPERFRASLDITDEAAHALLLKCDAEQKRLGEKINAPFTRTSARETAMSKAMITIESLERAKAFGELTPDQHEIMAESFAAIGRYDLASETTLLHRELYEKYWAAVWRNDEDWCLHPPTAQYKKEDVFSIREGKIMPLLACNTCGLLNVADSSETLAALQKKHDENHLQNSDQTFWKRQRA